MSRADREWSRGDHAEQRPGIPTRAVKTLLIICFNDLSRDPRVNRQIRAFATRYRVIAAGFGDPGIEGVEFVRITRARKSAAGRAWAAVQLLAGAHDAYYWKLSHVKNCLARLDGIRVDAVVANDIDALPVAMRVANGARVVFDAHEYAPRQFEDRLVFRLFFQRYNTGLCRRYIPLADAMMTVGESIARQYERDVGVRPVVVTNAPDYEPLEPGPVEPGRIRMVHHGSASRSRKLENMLRVMDSLDDRFTLDLLLVGAPAYVDELSRLAGGDPRIRFLPPVPMRELPRFLNRYDVGLYLLEPRNFNSRYALPNKFFEFIQARLAVAIGPSPEMARIVRETGCGIVAPDFSPASLAECLARCDDGQIARYKQRSHEIADRMSAKANEKVILQLVGDLLGDA